MVQISNLVLAISIIIAVYGLNKYFSGTWYCGQKNNLNGEYAVITGGNSGIGKATAINLAQQGCNIIIGALDIQKFKQITNQIQSLPNSGKIQCFPLDLGDLQSIQKFVKEIKTQHLEYLINNAGVMGIPFRKLTKSGFQMHCGVNYVGHYYLTHLLWDKLNKSSFFRVINISSITHQRILGFFNKPYINLDDINFERDKYTPQLGYSRSKFYNVLFTKNLAEKIDPSKGITVAVHPGVVRTGVLRYILPGWKIYLIKLITPLYAIFSKSSEQGAQTTIAMINKPVSELQSGGFYSDCKLTKPNPEITEQKWTKLWNDTQYQLKISFGIKNNEKK